MRRAHVVYRFGAFELDSASRRLTSGPEIVRLTGPQSAVLLLLVSSAPEVVGKEALAKAGWGGSATSDNNIEQVVSRLRKALSRADGAVLFETIPNRGYRFVAPIQQLEPQEPIGPPGVDLEPLRAFIQGRRELATLNRDAIANARRDFALTIQHQPTHAKAHIGLANACALAFDASRVDVTCDLEALAQAVDHARRATTLEQTSADAWSTLSFALSLSGDTEAAAVASAKAVTLAPAGWLHRLRLAYVSWGEDRIEAAQTLLTLQPDLALAHWLIGTVLISRGAFEAALIPVRAGCVAQDKQWISPGLYPAVGLHLLHGLILAAQERLDEAMRAFESELASPDGQLYSRECSANTWYARGAVHLRRREHDAATQAFRQALDVAPGHYFSMAALGRPLPTLSSSDPRVGNAALARSIALAREGRHADAAEVYRKAIASASASHAGWILPVEPILHVSARPEIWSNALTLVRKRAT